MLKNTVNAYVNLSHLLINEIDKTYSALQEIELKSKTASKAKGKQVDTKPHEDKLTNLAAQLVEISTFLKNNGYPTEGEEGLKKAVLIFKHFKKKSFAAGALNNLAVFYERNDRLQEAFNTYKEAVEIYDSLEEVDDLATNANALHGYACVWGKLNHNNTEAKKYYLRALEIRVRLTHDPKYKLAKTYLSLGKISAEEEDFSKAESFFKSGLSILESNNSPDPTLKQALANNLANIYQKQAAAISPLAKTLSFYEPENGFKHFDLLKQPKAIASPNDDFFQADFLHGFHRNEPNKENNEAALVFLNKALMVLEQYLAADSELIILLLQKIIRVLSENKSYKEAESFAKKANKLAKKANDEGLLKFSLITLAKVLEDLERYEEALATYDEAANVPAKKLSDNFYLVDVAIISGKGLVSIKLSHYVDAAAFYEKALQLHEQHGGPTSFFVAEALLNLSSIYEVLDRLAEMEAACKRAFEIYHSQNYFTEAAGVLLNQGALYSKLEHYEAAEKCYLKAYGIYKEKTGEISREVAKVLGNLGLLHYRKRENEISKIYFERALNIIEVCFSEDSPEKTGALTNYANLLIQLREFDLAETMLKRVFEILQKNNMYFSRAQSKALDGLGLLFAHKGKFAKARETYEKSLVIKRKIYPGDSSEIGETLSLLATLDTNDNDIEKDLSAAILHYENCKQGDSFTTCEIRLRLARHYFQQCKLSKDDRLREDAFSNAWRLYSKVLEINHNLINNSQNDFSEEDLSSHLTLLNEIASLFCLNFQFDKAAALFENEATTLSVNYPRISFECVERSIYFYKKCLNTQAKRAELFVFKLSLFKNTPLYLKPWPVLLSIVEELQNLDTAGIHATILREYTAQYAEVSENIEEDIYLQFERCSEIFFELERLFLGKFKNDAMDFLSNRTMELFISLRNILDQAYGRLLTRMLNEPYQKGINEFYFPVRDSLEALRDLLGRQKLLQSHVIVSAENLKIKNKNKAKIPAPPPINEILNCLMKAGLLKHVKKQIFQLINFDSNLTNITWQHDDLSKWPSLANYTKQILEKLKVIYSQCQHGLDVDCPISYQALVGEQPFTYFDPELNAKNAGLCDGSWIEKASMVNNASKHIHLTPHESKVTLQKQQGTLKKAKRSFQIHYLERRFYPWIFVEFLPGVLGHSERIKLSVKILDLLQNAGHVQNERSSHPIVRNYQASKVVGLSTEEQNRYREAYAKEIQAILLPLKAMYEEITFETIVTSVSEFLLRRGSHLGEIAYYEPDSKLDLNKFLKIAFNRIYHLLSVFGKETAQFQASKKTSNVSSPVIKPSSPGPSTISVNEVENFDDAASSETKISDLIKSVESFYKDHCNFKKLTCERVRDFYASLNLLVGLLTRHNKPDVLVKLLLNAARNFQNNLPILSIRFIEHTLQVYQEAHLHRLRFESVNLLSTLYENQMVFGRASRVLEGYINEELVDMMFVERVLELNKHLARESEKLDKDIFSQLEYLREALLYLSCEWHEYFLAKTNSKIVENKIKNITYELLIKIRHLLDHGFRRLLINTILEPNEETLQIEPLYNYPYDCLTPRNFQNRLRACLAIGNGDGKYNLDSNCLQIIEASQTQDWLNRLIVLTNKAKHEQQPHIVFAALSGNLSTLAIDIEHLLKFEDELEVIPFLRMSLCEVSNILHIFFEATQKFITNIKPNLLVVPLAELIRANTNRADDSTKLLLTAEQLKEKGNQLAGQKRYFDALQYYKQAVEVDPHFASAWLNKGIMHKELKEYADAITAFDHALSAQPNYAKAKFNRAQCLLLNGDYRLAYKAFDGFINDSKLTHFEAIYGRFVSQRNCAAKVFFLCVDLKLTADGLVKIFEVRSGASSDFKGLYQLGGDVFAELQRTAKSLNLPPIYVSSKSGTSIASGQNNLPSHLLAESSNPSNFSLESAASYRAICTGFSMPQLPNYILAEGDLLLSCMFEDRSWIQRGFEVANALDARPISMNIARRYDKSIVRQVTQNFPGITHFVLRASDLQGNSNLIVPKDDLDAVLQAILPSPATNRSNPEIYMRLLRTKYKRVSTEKTYTAAIEPLLRWAHSSADEFIIESFTQNKPITHAGKSYDPTMRAGVLVVKNNSVFSCRLMFCYWNLPPKPIKPLFILEQQTASGTTTNSDKVLKVAAEDQNLVYSKLKVVLPKLIQTLMNFSIEMIVDSKKSNKEIGFFYLHLSNSAAYIGQYDLSSYFLSKAKPLVENDYRYDREEGILFHFRGNYDAAITCFKRALEKDNLQPAVYFRMGESFLALRNFQEAKDRFIQACGLSVTEEFGHKLFQVLLEDSDFKNFWDLTRPENA